MASVWVQFTPRFPLGGGFPSEQFAPAWWYETAGGEEKLLLRNSTALWSRVVQEELLRWHSDFRREGNFPESKLSGFAPAVFEIRSARHETGFFAPAVFYSRRAPRGCSALREILLLEEIHG
jgi:hypothetical protein